MSAENAGDQRVYASMIRGALTSNATMSSRAFFAGFCMLLPILTAAHQSQNGFNFLSTRNSSLQSLQ